MSRKPRFSTLDYPQHVVHRGNNRRSIFFTENDYRTYLGLLLQGTERYACAVHAYVLMSNHVHLLMGTHIESGISRAMQWVGARYAEYVNRRYERTGSLWEGRYKSSLVESDRYVLACYRYIEMNPVRAYIVGDPVEYRWSSYRYNALGVEDEVVSPHPSYAGLSSARRAAESVYKSLCSEGVDARELEAIRKATRGELVYGSDRFKDRIEETTRRKTRRGCKGRPRKQR